MSLISKVNSLIYDVNVLSNTNNYNTNISLDFMNEIVNVTNYNTNITQNAFKHVLFNEYLFLGIIICLVLIVYINTTEINKLKKKLKL